VLLKIFLCAFLSALLGHRRLVNTPANSLSVHMNASILPMSNSHLYQYILVERAVYTPLKIVIEFVRSAFVELHYEVYVQEYSSIDFNARLQNTIFVSFFPCLGPFFKWPNMTIFFNLELLDVRADASGTAFRQCITDGSISAEVWASASWDYLENNVLFLQSMNIAAVTPARLRLGFYDGLVTPTYTPPWDRISHVYSYDVVFIGAAVTRRETIIADLRANNVSVLVISNDFDQDFLEKSLSSAKIALNIHFFVNNFEAPRITLLLSLGLFVVSEACAGIERELYSDSMVFSSYESLSKTIIVLLSEENREFRDKISKNGYRFVRSKSPGELLGSAINASVSQLEHSHSKFHQLNRRTVSTRQLSRTRPT